MKILPYSLTLLTCLIAGSVYAAEDKAWVAISNKNAEPVLDYMAKSSPESASFFGVDKYDTAIVDLKAKIFERQMADGGVLLHQLQSKEKMEKDSRVLQDLQIMEQSLKNNLHSNQLNHDLMLPFFSVSQITFSGLQQLLDPRNPPERQKLALTRLARYAGVEKGYTPLVDLAKARTMERMGNHQLVTPYADEIRQDLDNTENYISGIQKFFEDAHIEGWQPAHAALAKQLRDYKGWLEKNLLPIARKDNRLPEAIYADNLKQMGVDMEPHELMLRAQFGFLEIRDEMQALSARIAAEHHFPSSDYRSVMAELKKNQIGNDQLLAAYQGKLTALEGIIEKEQLLTLPKRKANIRLASDAESAQQPAPHMNPPRLIGNTGEYGEFVLPLSNPNSKSNAKMDDFTHDAGMWTLTAHEARPGHELQFASMVENGVSVPRAIFAFNSANVEGWGLYSEAIVKQYLPQEAQLFSLEKRLMRAARAFLDPMVNLGLTTPDDVKSFLMKEVGLSEPMAQQESDRYAFNAPGQATAYYYGYMKLREIRAQTEMTMREHFVQKDFHDFILHQGLLPPNLLAKAIREDFVKPVMDVKAIAQQ